jgi:hypothetical protein
MGAFIFILFILVLAGILVWQFIETRNALATTSVLTRHTADETAQIIESAFGGPRSLLWTNDRGPGTMNKRRRGYKHGITMSIDIEPQQDGRTQVSMWASRYAQYMFVLANMAGVVNRRKKAIALLLMEPAGQQQAVPAGQQSPVAAGQEPAVTAGQPTYPAPDQVANPHYQ